MKKYLLVVLVCLICICNIGCAVVEALDNRKENLKHAEKVSKELIRCINEKDVDGIEQLFNRYSQNEENLRSDIEDFLVHIDGEIVDYIITWGETSVSIDDGKLTEQKTETEIENIITDTGKRYYIRFREYMICTEDRDKEGILLLLLYDENKKRLCRICYM
ncbi:MAG: DUF5104 domain-containing protein [Lachnospiraceae bacterium]|nr:DUF5104 domain-containing protein [Lachnospiraceae bacterium]